MDEIDVRVLQRATRIILTARIVVVRIVVIAVVVGDVVMIHRVPDMVEVDMLTASAQRRRERVGHGGKHDTHEQKQGQDFAHPPIIGPYDPRAKPTTRPSREAYASASCLRAI